MGAAWPIVSGFGTNNVRLRRNCCQAAWQMASGRNESGGYCMSIIFQKAASNFSHVHAFSIVRAGVGKTNSEPLSMGKTVMTKQDMQEGRARAIANTALLFEDAKLLIEHSRFAGAFTIAVRGLEEIGKVILDTWNAVEPLPVPTIRSNAHDRKKMAVGSVLLGTFAMRQFGLPMEEISNDLIAQVGPVFRDSWEGHVLGKIGFCVPEPAYDTNQPREPAPADVDPSLMSRKDVETVFNMAKLLLDLLLDGTAMNTGLMICNQELARRWFGPLPFAEPL